MATNTLIIGGTTGGVPSRAAAGAQPVMVEEFTLDIAAWLAAKGSALAANDIVKCIYVPAGATYLGGGAEVMTVGNATAATIDVGTSTTDDTFVDAADIITATGLCAKGSAGSTVFALRQDTAGDVRVTLASLTGTLSTGLIRVYAVLAYTMDNPMK